MTLTMIAFSLIAAWAGMLLFRGGYWRCDQRLTDVTDPDYWPEVVAIVPARNEAATIGEVVASHARTDYPGQISTIIVDDQSKDSTAAQANAAAGQYPLNVLNGAALPSDWTGKLWAMQQGINKAANITPDAKYILFTDADIVLAPSTLARLVAKAERDNLALTSLMARLDMRGFWGGLLMPAFIYFFQKLYPFAWANNPDHPVAAAAGGVMLVRRDALDETDALAAIKGALIDDCALARLLKDKEMDREIWIGLAGDDAISIRDNRNLTSIWKMVTRTAYTQLQYSPALLLIATVAMLYLYVLPAALVLSLPLHGNIAAALFALIAYGLAAFSYQRTLRFYDHPVWKSVSLPLAASIYMAMTIDSARRHWLGKGGRWKGRSYS